MVARMPAPASSTATSTPASGRSIRRSPTRATSSAPPAKADGTPRACNFGDNPLTPAGRRLRLQRQAHRRAAVPGDLPVRSGPRGRRAVHRRPATRTATARTPHPPRPATCSSSAPVFGVERGPINGIAPGAWLSVYKVCGIGGCFDSDSAAAVQQAILDGVDVINFSISGGTDPFTDPVELAFLDAYAAGVFVSTSAGNDGPGAATANHVSPVGHDPVAASTQTREFASTLTVTAGAATPSRRRARRSRPASTRPCPIVLSSDAPYSRPLCDAPAPAGTVHRQDRGLPARGQRPRREGLQRPPGRRRRDGPVQPGPRRHRDRQPLAADGPPCRRHCLRRVHGLAHRRDRDLHRRPVSRTAQGDVMAAFSSRGPAGLVHQAGRHGARRPDPGRA